MNRQATHINTPQLIAVSLALLALVITSCRKEDVEPASGKIEIQTVPLNDTLRGVITEPTLLVNNRTWYIDRLVYISNEVTLTIEPGTVIKMITDSSRREDEMAGGIVVTRGARIVALGTLRRPVVFTVTDSSAQAGKGWSGIILLGRAPASKPRSAPESLVLPGGNALTYGGDLPDDSSGVLQYVRFDRLASRMYDRRQLYPGLLLLGTGSRTVIKNITARTINERYPVKKDARLP